MSKHTPGPWKWEYDYDKVPTLVNSNGETVLKPFPIRNMYYASLFIKHPDLEYTLLDCSCTKEGFNNPDFQLIASAPELLAENKRLKQQVASLLEAAKLVQPLINNRKYAIQKLINETSIFSLSPCMQGALGDYNIAHNKLRAAISTAEGNDEM